MESINIKAKNSKQISPAIDFDAQNGVCKIEGDSYLESPRPFYEPLLDWITSYTQEVKKPLEFNFRVKYFNTSTSGFFLDILLLLKEYENNGGVIKVIWYMEEPDVDLEEEIEDYQMDTDISIEIIRSYNE